MQENYLLLVQCPCLCKVPHRDGFKGRVGLVVFACGQNRKKGLIVRNKGSAAADTAHNVLFESFHPRFILPKGSMFQKEGLRPLSMPSERPPPPPPAAVGEDGLFGGSDTAGAAAMKYNNLYR